MRYSLDLQLFSFIYIVVCCKEEDFLVNSCFSWHCSASERDSSEVLRECCFPALFLLDNPENILGRGYKLGAVVAIVKVRLDDKDFTPGWVH